MFYTQKTKLPDSCPTFSFNRYILLILSLSCFVFLLLLYAEIPAFSEIGVEFLNDCLSLFLPKLLHFFFFTDVKPNYLKGLSHVLNRLPKPVLLPELPTVSFYNQPLSKRQSFSPIAWARKGRTKIITMWSPLFFCCLLASFLAVGGPIMPRLCGPAVYPQLPSASSTGSTPSHESSC